MQVGQRTDVVVEANEDSDTVYWMRSVIASGGCTEPSIQPLALAAIYYEKANTSALPTLSNSTVQSAVSDNCTDDSFLKTTPAYAIPAIEPSTTLHMEVNVTVNSTGNLIWIINKSSFRGNLNHPLLLLANMGNVSYPGNPEWNVYNVGSNETIRAVIRNVGTTSHPWHLHGHPMQILSAGAGDWDGAVVNGENPMRRDVQLLPAQGYLVSPATNAHAGMLLIYHVVGGAVDK